MGHKLKWNIKLKLTNFAVIFSKWNTSKLSKQNEEVKKINFDIFLLKLSLNDVFSYDIFKFYGFQQKIIQLKFFHPPLLLSEMILLRKYLIL